MYILIQREKEREGESRGDLLGERLRLERERLAGSHGHTV